MPVKRTRTSKTTKRAGGSRVTRTVNRKTRTNKRGRSVTKTRISKTTTNDRARSFTGSGRKIKIVRKNGKIKRVKSKKMNLRQVISNI